MPKDDEAELKVHLDGKLKYHTSNIQRLLHRLKSDKEIILVKKWLKKLEDDSYTSILERKNRNLYVEILHRVVESNHLKEPFDEPPPKGKLPTIPAYMSNYLNKSISLKENLSPNDWLGTSEFESSLLSSLLINDEESFRKYKEVLSPRKREKFLLMTSLYEDDITKDYEITKSRNSHKLDFHNDSDVTELEKYLNNDHDEASTVNKKLFKKKKMTAQEEYEEFYKNKTNSSSSSKSVEFIESYNQFDERFERKDEISTREKELEKKLILMERRCVEEKNIFDRKIQEERLKIEQDHDHTVKKILERKNHEISELRKSSIRKINDLQDQLGESKTKVDALTKDLSQTHDKHIHEINTLKDISSKARSDTMSHYEKLMHEKMDDFEKEVSNLKQTHNKNIKEILIEANDKIEKNKSNFNNMKLQMQNEVIQLQKSLEVTKANLGNFKQLQQENEDLKKSIANCDTEITDLNKRNKILEEENSKLIQEYEDSVKSLKRKSETAIKNVNNELKTSESKFNLMKSELESKIEYYRKTLQDMQMLKEKAIQEVKMKCEEREHQLKQENLNKIAKLSQDFEDKQRNYESTIRDCQLSIHEKDAELKSLSTRTEQLTKETERQVEKFKAQAKEESTNMFNELSRQLENLQKALEESKSIIEKQKSDFAERLEKQKSIFDEQLNTYKHLNEAEKLKLHQNYKKEKEILQNNASLDKEDIKKKYKSHIEEIQNSYNTNLEGKSKMISDLEIQVKTLREEVLQANQLRKKQLSEVSKLREEEKVAAQKIETDLRRKLELLEVTLEKQYVEDQETKIKKCAEKMERKMKMLSEEYEEKLATNQKIIENLRDDLKTSKEESQRKNKLCESELQVMGNEKKEMENNFKKEKQLLNKFHGEQLKKLENSIVEIEITCQEKISRCRLICEQKLKGMLPINVQQGMDETISALREQVDILQKRTKLLEIELEHSTNVVYGTRGDS